MKVRANLGVLNILAFTVFLAFNYFSFIAGGYEGRFSWAPRIKEQRARESELR